METKKVNKLAALFLMFLLLFSNSVFALDNMDKEKEENIENKFSVNIIDSENGKLNFKDSEEKVQYFKEGENAVITVKAKDSYKLIKVEINIIGQHKTEITPLNGEFTVPVVGNTEIKGIFEKTPKAASVVESEKEIDKNKKTNSIVKESIENEKKNKDDNKLKDNSDEEESEVEKYILSNADKKYVGSGKIAKQLDIVSVANTVINTSKYDIKNLDDLWTSKNSFTNNGKWTSFERQVDTIVPLYGISKDSKYLVAKINMLNSAGEKFIEYQAADTCTDGTAINGVIFDREKGLLYVPKTEVMPIDLKTDKGTLVPRPGRVRFQILWGIKKPLEKVKTSIDVVVTSENVKGDVVDKGISYSNASNLETKIKIAKNSKSVKDINRESIDEVLVNGKAIADEEITYEKSTGSIVVNDSPINIDTLEVKMSNTFSKKVAKKAKKFLPIKEAYAAAPPSNPEYWVKGVWEFDKEPSLKEVWYLDSLNKGYYAITAESYYASLGITVHLGQLENLAKWIYDGTDLDLLAWDDKYFTWNKTKNTYRNSFTRNSHIYAQTKTGTSGTKLTINTPIDIALACVHSLKPSMATESCFLRLEHKGNGYALFGCVIPPKTGYDGGGQSACGLIAVKTKQKPSKAKLKIVKKSQIPMISNGNECYRLDGAVYGVYTDFWCKNLVTTITTGANGISPEVTVPQGEYFIKEISPPKGFVEDGMIFPISARVEDSLPLEVYDFPKWDPADLEITKIWSGEKTKTIPSLEGTQFTVNFYAGHYTENNLPLTPTRSWVFEIKEVGGKYKFRLEDEYKVSGDALYKTPNGIPFIPLGTISIQETKPAFGYSLEGYLKDTTGKQVSTTKKFVQQIVEEGDATYLKGGNKYTGKNEPEKGNIIIRKVAENKITPIPGVKFQLINSSGKLVDTQTTNRRGMVFFDNLYPDVYTIKEIKSKTGYQLLAKPIKVSIPSKFTRIELNKAGIPIENAKQNTGKNGDYLYYVNDMELTVINSKAFMAPYTGGKGTIEFFYLGVALIIIASGIFLLSSNKNLFKKN